MLSAELLILLGGTAILPYLAEAFWSWAREKYKHQSSAKHP